MFDQVTLLLLTVPHTMSVALCLSSVLRHIYIYLSPPPPPPPPRSVFLCIPSNHFVILIMPLTLNLRSFSIQKAAKVGLFAQTFCLGKDHH